MLTMSQILGVTCNNTTANNIQVRELVALPNSFDATNQIRCYNHTLNLAVKALLKPFLGPDKKKKGKASEKDKDKDDSDPTPDVAGTVEAGEASATIVINIDDEDDLAFADGDNDPYDVFEDKSNIDSEEETTSEEDNSAHLQRSIAEGCDTVWKVYLVS